MAMTTPRWVDWAVVLGCSLFLLLGGWLLILGLTNIWRAQASERWPRTTARVSRSDAASATSYDREEHTTSVTYSTNIEYRYQVGGREYTGSRRHFGQTEGSGDSSEAEVLRFRYPANAGITVAYDPADPSMSVAEPGFDMEALWLPGAGLGFAVPSIMFIVLWFGMSRGNGGFAIGLGIFASIFTAIGLIFLILGTTNLSRSLRSIHWPVAKGAVVYGRIDESQSRTHDGDGTSSVSTSHGAHLVYEYEVDGRKYYSNVRRFGQIAAGSDEDALDIASRYPRGSKVQVAYCPDNPGIAALETGIARESYWIPGVGAAFFLFGLAVFIFGIPVMTR